MIIRLTESALVDEFGFPTNLSTIELNTDPSNPQDDDTLIVTGFGTIFSGGPASNELLDVEVQFIPDDECAALGYGR